MDSYEYVYIIQLVYHWYIQPFESRQIKEFVEWYSYQTGKRIP